MIPSLQAAKHRDMEPTEGRITPAVFHLDTFDGLWQYGDAKHFEEWKIPRTTRLLCSPLSARRAASIRIATESAAGSSHRVRGREFVGEATSAGSVNSQSCLHAANAKRR